MQVYIPYPILRPRGSLGVTRNLLTHLEAVSWEGFAQRRWGVTFTVLSVYSIAVIVWPQRIRGVDGRDAEGTSLGCRVCSCFF